MTDQDGKRAGLYKRISDDPEGLELGVARQEQDLRAAAEQAGDEIVDTYCDNDRGASTRSKKPRPDYDRLLADARAGRINRIWAYTSSRLTRRPLELEGQIKLAEQYGVQFAYLRSPTFDLNSADGRQIARIMAATDAAEAERTGERVSRTFQQIAESGGYRGGPRPFGWQSDGVTPVLAELEAIATACDEILGGGKLRAIRERWNKAGLRGGKGAEWSTTTVKQVLMRWRNAGVIEVDGQVLERDGQPVKAAWWDSRPAELDTVRAVRAILTDPTRNKAGGNTPRWLGSGMYECWGCEQPDLRVSGPAARTRMYRCGAHRDPLPDRHHVSRQAALLDDMVENVIVARLSRPDARRLLRHRDTGLDAGKLHTERAKVATLIAELDDDRDHERISRSRYLARNEALSLRLAAVDEQLAAMFHVDPLAGLVDADDPHRVWFGTLPDRSDGLSLDRRRAVLKVVASVTVLPARRGSNGFDRESIRIEQKR